MLEDIRDLLDAHPFQPFKIVTAGGQKYRVTNPHNVALMESRIFYAFPKTSKWAFIRLNQITAIESDRAA